MQRESIIGLAIVITLAVLAPGKAPLAPDTGDNAPVTAGHRNVTIHAERAPADANQHHLVLTGDRETQDTADARQAGASI